jgi:metal-responsive CopG/Arc/MetJ family transcriptional regulator
MGRTAKVTVSLPGELISVADRIARENKISRSQVISACLQDLAEKHKQAQMAEGYSRLAEEQKKFTATASNIESEIWPEWK